MRKALSLLLILILITSTSAQPKLPKNLSKLDNYVTSVMQEFKVPGLGLAIVKDGIVLVSKGYGLRKLGEPTPVNAQTLFGIASNTKAFTATALAILVHEGKLEWDAPVINYLPWFQLADPYVTRELTIRDLLVHRSGLGLGAGDLLWWPATTYDRKEIVRRLRHIPLVKSFRSAYAYDNVLYSVAGEVIEAVSGQTWEDFVAQRILGPVGMVNSKTRISAFNEAPNVAIPHAEIEGRVRPVVPFVSDNVNPAGGILSNAEDMARWMIVQLDSGRLQNGERLFPPATMRQLWGFVTPIPIADPPAELAPLRANFNGYALGFSLRDYRGYKLVSHTGGLPGYVSRVAMIPELKLGVAVLTNQESGYAFNTLVHHILDQFMGAQPFDWLAAYRKIKFKADSTMAAREQKIMAARDSTSRPSLPLTRYAGNYADAWYGEISIALEQDRLVMRFSHTPDLVGDLEHWQYDTFIVRWRNPELRADAFVTFALNPDGSIEQAKMRAVSPATDFSFDFQDLLLKPVKPK
ncbi:MAG: serine hydrolase [candidate division KSB1 bacterium]|nr:serine hydrolase [candidate division KSB1 bacterium]